MYSLMMQEYSKRFGLISLILQPIYSYVGNQISNISLSLYCIIIHTNKIRIIIIALTGKNFPIIKSRRQTFKMPLTHQCCLVSGFSEKFRHCLLRRVKNTSGIIGESICMTVFSRNHTSPARPA